MVQFPNDNPHDHFDLAVVNSSQVKACDVHYDSDFPQIMGHPTPALHINDDATDQLFGRDIQRSKGPLADHAIGIESMPLLKMLDCIDQLGVIFRGGKSRRFKVPCDSETCADFGYSLVAHAWL